MDASRRKMIETAEERFASRGREGLKLSDLARRLGLPPRAVFKEFKTRDELFVAVLGKVQEGLFAHLEAQCATASGESGLDMALSLAEAYCRFLETRSESYLALMRDEDGLLAGLGPLARAEVRRLRARMVEQFETLLRLGHWDGSVRTDMAADAARRCVHVLVGLVRLRLTRPEADRKSVV